jgi:hypothetical protein
VDEEGGEVMNQDETDLLVLLVDDRPATHGAAQEPPKADPTTPARGDVHEVPIELLETLEACWSRCRMAGMERARGERRTHLVAVSSTVLGAVTGASAYTALQSHTDLASRWVVTIVALCVAVLGALQTFVTRQVQANAAAMDDVAGVFHGLHVRLVAAASEARLTGALPDPALLEEARKARSAHLKSMPQERPSFHTADASVQRDMRALGLLR